MSRLLSLPEEVFGAVLEALVRCGLNHALTAKLVCKRFDIEVTRAICATRLLERDDVRDCRVGRTLATEYLVARTLANDVTHELCPSHTIIAVLNEICRRNPDAMQQRELYIRLLARATLDSWVTSSADWRQGDNIKIRIGVPPEYPNRTLLENLFAATACLGMKSLFDELRSQNIPHEDTFFGQPLKSAICAGHTDIVADFLRTSDIAKQYLYANRTLYQFEIYPDNCLSANMIRLLLDPGLTSDAPSDFYRKLLAHAAFQGDDTLVRLCLDRAETEGYRGEICCPHDLHGTIPHTTTFAQEWVLFFAIQGGQFDLVQSSLTQGVSVRAFWYANEETLLNAAATRGYIDIVKLLLEHGATEDAHESGAKPVVGEAARTGFVAIIELLLDCGFDMNLTRHFTDLTPAMLAARYGQIDALRLLLCRGADLGPEPLQEAVQKAVSSGQTDIFEALSKHAASIS